MLHAWNFREHLEQCAIELKYSQIQRLVHIALRKYLEASVVLHLAKGVYVLQMILTLLTSVFP